MRLKSTFPLLPVLAVAAMVTGCAHPGPLSSLSPAPNENTETHKTPAAKPAPFTEYQTLAGMLSGAPGAWNIAQDSTTRPLRGILALKGIRDSLMRTQVYSADFLPGTFQEKDVRNALAYLFKADVVDSIPSPPGFEDFKVLLPPNDGDHCGLLRLTDSTLVYLNLQGVPNPRLNGCRVEGLSLNTTFIGGVNGVANPWNDEKRKQFLAALINTIGLKALEDSSYSEAQRRFQQAFALDSTVPDYLVNEAVIHVVRNEPSAGINLLLRYPQLVESSGQLCGILGAFYEDVYRYPEARDWALKALEKDPENHEWLINLSDALWGMGEKVQSKNVLLRPYAEKPDFRLGVYLAATYLGLEEYEDALKILAQAQADSAPTAKSVAYTLRAYLGLKQFEEGLDFIQRLNTVFPITAENLFLKAACEFNLNLYRQAEGTVRASLHLDPSNRESQELETRLTALLGGKSNEFLRAPIVPLKTTLDAQQARTMLRDSGLDTRMAGYPIYLIAQQIVQEWVPEGRWKRTRHMFFRVPDGTRLIRFSELIFNLNPSYERFYVNRLRIFDSDWNLVHESGLEDYYVTRNPAADLHPENLLAHLVLKTRPGPMFVELLLTEEAQVTSPEFPYVRFEHRAGYPVAFSQFELLHPPKNLLISPFGDVQIDSLPDRLVLTMPVPAFPAEGSFAPEAEAYASGFSAVPFSTWREVGLRYLEELKKNGIDVSRPPLMAVERASQIIANAPTENPVKALFRYVRDSIRYDNYEIGLQAGIPDSAPAVLARGYADCKGHALLLAQMLRARGIEANLSLVNLYSVGDAGQPHINQFNHMIVQVPRQRGIGPYFLDPTDKFSAFRRYPLGLEGRNTLVLDSANPQLISIPEIDSAEEHSVRIFHDLEVRDDQMARGCDSLVLSGKAAAEFREHLSTWRPAQKEQNLISWLASGYSAFNEDSFRILDENNPDEPLTMVLRYHARFPYLDSLRFFDYFPKLELSFLQFPDARHRNTPVYFPHEITVESNWIYRLPPGFGWKSLSLARELEQEYLHWRFSIQQSAPETITLRQEWHIDPFLAEPDEYRNLRTAWDPVFQSCGLRLAISRL